MIRTYDELILLPTFKERFEYLRLDGEVGAETFSFDRVFNQMFYKSAEWRRIRHQVIVRDNGCDLAVPGCDMFDKILVHHMNPITVTDIKEATEYLMNPNYLICVSQETHNAIHYGSFETAKDYTVTERKPGDTKLW